MSTPLINSNCDDSTGKEHARKKAKIRPSLILRLAVLASTSLHCNMLSARDLVLGTNHWPPRIDLQTEPISGIDIEIIKALMQQLNLRSAYRACPFKRCLSWMQTGGIDIQGSLLRRAEREQYMHYIDPPYLRRSTKVFYIKRGKGYVVNQHEDLYKYSIGVRQGYVYFPKFDKDSKLNKLIVRQDIQLLKMLEHDRVDIVIGTENNMDYLIHTSGFRNKFEKASYRYDKDNPVYFAISKKSTFAKQLPQFNQVMRQLVEDGKVEQLVKSYFRSIGIEH